MSFDWSEFLRLANELAQQGSARLPDEAKQRSAISRAYYSVFGKARNHLLTRQPHLVIPKTGTAHKVVPDEFARSMNQMSRAVATELQRLRDLRNQADYDEVFPKLEEHMEYALLSADKAMAALDQL